MIKKNNLTLFSMFLIATIIYFFLAHTRPLSLDEIYSLYFAKNYSPLGLLFHLPETHPGAYYLFVKVLLNLSLNLTFLRIFSSIIPALIGIYLFHRHHQKNLLTFVLLFNPFIIHQSYQLRMFGITVFFTCLYLLFFIYNNKKNFYLFIVLAILSTFFTFSLIIPLLSFCLYQIIINHQKKYFSIFLLLPILFLTIKGLSTYKNYTELASWINPPTFYNLPSTILTLFAYHIDLKNILPFSFFPSLLFYSIFLPIIYFFSKKNPKFLYFFTIPFFISILVSLLFPFLSQHFFFYKFIPKISLLLPRFLLPFSIIFFYFLFSDYFKRIYLILFLSSLFWINTFIKINLYNPYRDATPLNYSPSTLVFPPWENLRLNFRFSSNDLQNITQKFSQASLLETSILNLSSCQILSPYQKIIYLPDSSIKNLNLYQKQITTFFDSCCHQETLYSWTCTKVL